MSMQIGNDMQSYHKGNSRSGMSTGDTILTVLTIVVGAFFFGVIIHAMNMPPVIPIVTQF